MNDTNQTEPSPEPHTKAIPTEGGILNGVPILSTPIGLLIVQILLILCLSRFLSLLIKKINQPRVIAEVIAGILLGPTAFGRIPGFTEAMFPPDRIKYLKLVSDLGLIFFLFIVGLELDLSLLKTNAKKAIIISLIGMVIPFAIGAGVGVFLKEVILSITVPAGSVVLFIGVAYAITAFPVLARILTELKLLGTPVGVISISASAVGDTIAWCLLALTVAIVSSSTPLSSLYIFLILIGFCTIMGLIGFFGLSRITIPDNPSQNLVMFALIICLIAAWFTDFIGVHAIFGAFITGVILPRKAGFNVHLIEKIEDLVSIIFLPLYFAYSGLATDIGLLNSGLAWGAVILVISCACIAKITSSALASKMVGLPWRESLAVGILMNTKGLVELIVLNIGLAAKVIDRTVFTIMVLMALITTFMTTPLIKCIYPSKYHVVGGVKNKEPKHVAVSSIPLSDMSLELNVLVCVAPVPPMPLLMNIVQMFANYNKRSENTKLLINTAQMIEVTDRYSSVFNAANPGDDTISPVIEGFATLNGVKISNQKIISSEEHFTEDVVHLIEDENIDIVFFPWQLTPDHEKHDASPDMIEALLKVKPLTVACLINSGVVGVINLSEAKFMVPFFGGVDDRKAVEMALSFGLLTCIIHYKTEKELEDEDEQFIENISHFSEKDPSVIYSSRKFNETEDDIVAAITQEYDNSHFSIICLGYTSTIHPSSDPSEFERRLGTLAGKLVDANFPLNIMVVKSGDNCSFLNFNKTEEEDED